jgi:hypothetical protein
LSKALRKETVGYGIQVTRVDARTFVVSISLMIPFGMTQEIELR